MNTWFRTKSGLAGVFLLLLSGAALVAAFPPYDQAWLGWVALIPALLALRISPEIRLRPFAAGYAVGLVYFGGVFWWIGYVTVAGTVALVLYLALYPAVWLWFVARRLSVPVPLRSGSNLVFAGVAASAWVALEWWRGWFLTGFGWNPLAVSQHLKIPFVQLAGLGGVYLLSWLLAFVNAVGALTLERLFREARGEQKPRPHFDFACALVLVALAFAYGLHRILSPVPAKQRSLKYVCVQANIPQSVKNERLDLNDVLRRHVALSEQAEQLEPDLLLWPETATGLGIFTDQDLHDAVWAISHRNHFYFLLGAQDSDPQHIYNAAFLFSPGGVDYQVYRKNRLVVFGEFTPFANELPFMRWLVPFSLDYSPGDSPVLFDLPEHQVRMAPLICFEDTLPRYVRTVAQLRPDVLVNITNDGWFQSSPGPAQHLANAVFRTVELDVPLLRCANTGITAAVDRFGVVRNVLQDGEERRTEIAGLLSGELQWSPMPETLYVRWGDWIVLLSAGVIVIFAYFHPRSSV